MRKFTICLLVIITTFLLVACHDKKTLPNEEIPYKLTQQDGKDSLMSVNTYQINESSSIEIIYLAGIFLVDGHEEIKVFGYDIEENEYWSLGTGICKNCELIEFKNVIGNIPILIFSENDLEKESWALSADGMGSFRHSDLNQSSSISNTYKKMDGAFDSLEIRNKSDRY